MRLRSSRSRAALGDADHRDLNDVRRPSPWMGMLIASRSAALRTWKFVLWIAGR